MYTSTITCGVSYINENFKTVISVYSSKEIIPPYD